MFHASDFKIIYESLGFYHNWIRLFEKYIRPF